MLTLAKTSLIREKKEEATSCLENILHCTFFFFTKFLIFPRLPFHKGVQLNLLKFS